MGMGGPAPGRAAEKAAIGGNKHFERANALLDDAAALLRLRRIRATLTSNGAGVGEQQQQRAALATGRKRRLGGGGLPPVAPPKQRQQSKKRGQSVI